MSAAVHGDGTERQRRADLAGGGGSRRVRRRRRWIREGGASGEEEREVAGAALIWGRGGSVAWARGRPEPCQCWTLVESRSAKTGEAARSWALAWPVGWAAQSGI